jgi:hypothetical protein
MQSDQGSHTFQSYVSRPEQARWLSAGYGIADRLASVAGLGWLGLLDEPPARDSANWGLMTSSGQRKPAFYAYLRAPSARLRPTVALRAVVTRAGLARSGVLRPRVGGRVRVSVLTRVGRPLARTVRRMAAGRSGRAGIRARVPRSGTYLVAVQAPRGERVVRPLRVR